MIAPLLALVDPVAKTILPDPRVVSLAVIVTPGIFILPPVGFEVSAFAEREPLLGELFKLALNCSTLGPGGSNENGGVALFPFIVGHVPSLVEKFDDPLQD
jgi:hypothetical protein